MKKIQQNDVLIYHKVKEMRDKKWGIYVTKRFQKDYRNLPSKIKTRINSVVEELRNDPFKGSLIKTLGVRRLRIGDYRILYLIDKENDSIVLLTVFHRRKGYKRLV